MPENTLSGEFELPVENSSGTDDEQNTDNPVESNSTTFDPTIPAHKSVPHFFSSFCYYPKGIKLDDQGKDEVIVLIVRRRFIVNLPWIITAIFSVLIFPILAPFIISFSPFPPISTFQSIIIALFYYLLIFGFVLLKFTLWYFHVGIVTNKRIKDIDIHGILYRDISETTLGLVQDVNFKQHGFLPSLFNFGDVFVQTAGSEPNIEFDKAPMPAKIGKIIADMLKRH